jgi:H+/Cl- antiporter ClcA
VTNPVVPLVVGAVALGGLGALGGTITLFKGLDEMKQLTANSASYSTGKIVVIIAVKLAALTVAASCGFRGGRIFPAVFIGVAIGVLAHDLIPSIQPVLAISSGVLGTMLAVSRDGWLALFMAATVVGDVHVLPLLCVVVLPVWLLASSQPVMEIAA